MACGAIAFTKLGLPIDRYVAYEYDEESANAKKGRPFGFAALVASHNFPFIEQRGDVFQADFTEFEGFDFVIGGSPCTYWSIAQKNNRETEASGLGWELFSQYVRAVHEAKPKYFLYENNKSMSKEIKASITEAFGFEPVLINSALVSAQNRQRLYWVGIRQPDGTYRKADVEQPGDRGILLRDILDGAEAWREKSYCIDANYYKGGNLSNFTKQSGMRFMAAEPVRIGCYPSPDGALKNSQGMRLYDINAKSVNLTAQGGGMGAKTGLYAVPIVSEALSDRYYHGNEETQVFGMIDCKNTSDNNGQPAQGTRIYNTNCKSICLDADSRKYIVDQYNPQFVDEKGKEIVVYEVHNGLITIKDKQYPIKLADGFYIIRKLTVSECMRLQTVPEWYDFSAISNSQAYKCLGNGWTVDVITHLIQSAQIENAPTEAATSMRAKQNILASV